MAEMKRCSKCGEKSPATTEYFQRHKSKPDGLSSYCKPCARVLDRDRYAKNPEPKKEYVRKWKAENPEEHKRREHESYLRNREKRLQANREYRRRHQIREAGQRKAYRESHRKQVAEWSNRYYRNNRKKCFALVSKRRARKLSAEGTYAAEDIRRQLNRQNNLCYWCSEPLQKYHIDHVIPISRGGTNWPDNLVCACPHCNHSKKDKLPYSEWIPPNPLFPR